MEIRELAKPIGYIVLKQQSGARIHPGASLILRSSVPTPVVEDGAVRGPNTCWKSVADELIDSGICRWCEPHEHPRPEGASSVEPEAPAAEPVTAETEPTIPAEAASAVLEPAQESEAATEPAVEEAAAPEAEPSAEEAEAPEEAEAERPSFRWRKSSA
jgi:hypothetical protein